MNSDAIKIASLFGTAELDDKLTPGLQKMEAGINKFSDGALDKLQKRAASVANGIKSAFQALPFAAIIGVGIAEANGLEQALTRVNSVLKSTGEKAGVSRDSIVSFSRSMQTLTRFSDDTTLSAQAVLLTFTSIGKEIFPAATEAAMDMTTILGGDLQGAILQVGKALNDPTEGVNALRRAGVSFTKAQQDEIKALQSSGRLLEAQKIILKELQTEFGGAARAAGQTFAGRLDILKNRLLDIAEGVGNAVLPTLTSLADGAAKLLAPLENLDPSILGLSGAFGLVAIAAGPVAGILGTILGPVTAITGAVIALKTAWDTNFGGIRDLVADVWNAIKPNLDLLTGTIGNLGKGILEAFEGKPVKVYLDPNPVIPKDLQQKIKDGIAPEAITKGYFTVPINAKFQQGMGEDLRKEIEVSAPSLGVRLASAISKAWPAVQIAIEKLGADFQKFLIEKLGVSPELINTIGDAFREFFRPIADGFKNLGQVDWANLATAGGIIAAIAGGLLAFKPAVGMFMQFEAFKHFTQFLKTLGDLVADLKSGDVGKILADVGKGAISLAAAVTLFQGANLLKSGGLGAMFGIGGAGSSAIGAAGAQAEAAVGGATGILGKITSLPLWAKLGLLGAEFSLLSSLLERKDVQDMPRVWTDIFKKLMTITAKVGESAGVGPSPAMQKLTDRITAKIQAPTQFIGSAVAGVGANASLPASDSAKQWSASIKAEADAAEKAMIAARDNTVTAWQIGFGAGGTATVAVQTGFNEQSAAAMQFKDALAKGFAQQTLVKLMTTPFVETVKTIGGILAGLGGIEGMPGPLAAIGASIIGVANAMQSRDRGGPGKAGMPYFIGKGAQPEVFIPDTNGTFIPNADRYAQTIGASRGGVGGAMTMQFGTVNVYGVTDVSDFYDQLEREGKRRNQAWR